MLSERNRALIERVVGSWRVIQNDYGVANVTLPEATIDRLLDAARAEGGDKGASRGCGDAQRAAAACQPEGSASAATMGAQTAILIACGALLEAAEYFERFADVNDGDNGVPEPNEAARLLAEMEAALTAMAAAQRQTQRVDQ